MLKSRFPPELPHIHLKPVMIPDLGLSLDGHLDERGYLQTTADGLGIKDMENIHNSEFNIVIGLSLGNAVKSISELTGLATYYFPNVCGLKNSDKLFNLLSELSSKSKSPSQKFKNLYLISSLNFVDIPIFKFAPISE